MSVTHANGSKIGGPAIDTRDDLGNTVDTMSAKTKQRAAELAEQGKDVARRRPVPLVTAAAAGVATVVVAVVTVMRSRRKQTPRQRAMKAATNAWRSTSKSVRKRVKR
ncbi:hypothetical protein GCM10009827_067000 [Dactylosporangium maewongense]|uniref:DUF3618 domain-containing protein n=1 Tax=Dactylosporangium maewongense TaxID=634393 RepID=A0ABP4MBF9_9ACTN